jgi:tetratricopeptide (TPR) repeat protein
MYMRRAGALCLCLVAAHYGRSQPHSMEQQLRTLTEYAVTPSNADWVERQEAVTNPGTEESIPSGERISVAALRHKVPGKALAAFSNGTKLAAAGNFQRAAHEFARAVKIDPDYADAHGNLGVMYVSLSLPEQATGEFRRAIALDPSTSFHHANLALALIQLNLPKEAEAEAQAAVDLDHLNPRARYLLGFLLARRPETRSRAAEHLQYAARNLPDAHLILANLYRLEGADALAQSEQERYRKAILDSINAP